MKKSLSLLSLLMAVIGLQGCQSEEAVVDAKPLGVSVIEVAEPVSSQFRSFNGQVEPAENTPLAFRVEGEISRVLVKTGQQVRKGQLLASLDADKFEQQLRDAKVQFDLALKQLERGRELYSRNMISSAELDELTANRSLTQVRYESAKARLGYTRLVAPFSGVVSSVPKESFEAVSPGEAVVSLYQDDRVYINIPVSDTVIAMVNPAAVARNYQPMARFGNSENRYPVTYLEHTSELEPQSQTYRMWFDMPQVTPAILPGTSVVLDVNMAAAGLSTLQGYQLPMTALQAGRDPGQFFAWTVKNGKAHKVPVGIEVINNRGVIVNSGIGEGDQVINSSLRKLREGMGIAVLSEDGIVADQ